MYFHTQKNKTISLKNSPLGRGGEGNVYEVLEPQKAQNLVAKIYHPQERSKLKELKVNYLIENGSPLLGNSSLVWVKEALYEKQDFVGFLMPKAPGMYDLTSLCNLRLSPSQDHFQQKFSRVNRQGLLNRLKLCLRIAEAVKTLHQTKRYVLADMKPENIKVSTHGYVSVIDLDSIEIFENDSLLFPAEKLSAEYAPPEIKELNLKKDIISPSWDCFSMAIVFYKVLLGLHPFAATGKDAYEHLVSLDQKIHAGLFVHGSQSNQLKVIPKPHQNFKALPLPIQEIFLKCLDQGIFQPELRPSAEDWCNTLNWVIQDYTYYPEWRNYQKKVYAPTLPSKKVKRPSISIGLSPKKTVNTAPSGGYMGSVFYLLIILLFLYIGNLSNMQLRLNKFGQTITHAMPIKSSKLYVFKKDGKYGFVDIYHNEIIPVMYDYAWEFKGGLAKVVLNGRWGFIDKNNQAQIPIQYDKLGNFKQGLAPAKLGGKYGYINKRNKIYVPFICEEAHEFHQGRAIVKVNKQYKWIDTRGLFHEISQKNLIRK